MADWTATKYPGDHVRIQLLFRPRDNELGDVRIQDYGPTCTGNRYKVGSFLPGVTECSPGDTPKTWPDRHTEVGVPADADREFERHLKAARGAGWRDYDREVDGNRRT